MAGLRTIVVMGVSGSGKSTVAARLAKALHWPLIEGDDHHPPANIAKMAAGHPLDDTDRAPWLDRLADAIAGADGCVVACSALKRRYRDTLRRGDAGLMILFLNPSRAELERRLARRRGHFMPGHLLSSQLDTLEPPAADEYCLTTDGAAGMDAIVALVRGRLAGQTDAVSPPSTNSTWPLT